MPTDDISHDTELNTLVAAGRKIEAIRRYRELTGLGLTEAAKAVEALMHGESSPSTKREEEPFESQIISLLLAGDKIAAIKLYRDRTGVGLKDAKDFIEALPADRRVSAPSRSGCLGVVFLLLFIAACAFA